MYQPRQPHKIRIDRDDLKDIPGTINPYTGLTYLSYQGQPFNGFRQSGYYDNGQVVNEFEYVDGEDIGWRISFYENGMVERESLDYGQTTVFFVKYDEQGNKTLGGFLAEGLLDEVCAITGQDPKDVER